MNVFVFGHYGGKNFGDEVMLYSLLENLVSANVDNIFVVSKKRSSHFYSRSGVTYVLPHVMDVIRVLPKVDSLILGGGTHFHDGYNPARLRKHYLYLLKVLLFFLIGKLTGKNTYQLGVGFGPFHGRVIRWLTVWSLKLSDRVTVRDNASFKNLESIGTDTSKVTVSFDLAALYSGFKPDDSGKMQKREWVGISVTSFRYNEFNSSDNFWLDYFFKKFSLIYTDTKIKVKIFVFRGGNKESDQPLSETLYRLLADIDATRVQLVPFTEDIVHFVNELKTCRHFIATRYHSAVLGYLSECKLLLIPYHDKLRYLADDIQLSSDAILKYADISRAKTDKQLKRFFKEAGNGFEPALPKSEAVRKSEHSLRITNTNLDS